MKKLDVTKPVTTRDGRPARIICTDRKGLGDFDLIVLVNGCTISSSEMILCYSNNGTLYADGDLTGRNDLINVVEKTSTWQNMYPSDGGSTAKSKAEAYGQAVKQSLIGYLRRDYEDGVFVSATFEPVEEV